MCNPYIDFSPIAPSEFKIKFSSAYKSHIISTRLIAYCVLLGAFYPIVIGATQQLLKQDSYLKQNFELAIPIGSSICLVLFGILLKYQKNTTRDVKALLMFTSYFTQSPALEPEEEDAQPIIVIPNGMECAMSPVQVLTTRREKLVFLESKYVKSNFFA